MKYPVFLRKFNKALGALAGVMFVCIAFMAVMESIARSVFGSPTTWSIDISSYFLVIGIFLGCGYAYQEKGHVGVEFIRDIVQKKFGIEPRRWISVGGYIASLVVIITTMQAVYRLLLSALETKQLTFAFIQIPISFLYVVMIAGSVIMCITVLFIILDLFKKEVFYL